MAKQTKEAEVKEEHKEKETEAEVKETEVKEERKQYEWRCLDCDARAPATRAAGMELLGHAVNHHIRLVDMATGEAVAASAKEAQSKGIHLPPGKKATVKGESGKELSEEGITFQITLPPAVFTLFAAARAHGLVNDEVDFNQWLYECVEKRFQLDYKLQLMLVPVSEEESTEG